MKKLFLLLALFCANLFYSQDFTITGKLIDSEKKAVESATIYLESKKDSL